MANRTVTIINGDGIGPEVMAATIRVSRRSKVPLDYEYKDAGAEVIAKYGTNLPDETVEAVLRSGVALKGPTGTVVGGGLASANVGLRKRLDLYSSLRPVKTLPGVKTPYDNVDLVVVRENTEGLYAGLEHSGRARRGRERCSSSRKACRAASSGSPSSSPSSTAARRSRSATRPTSCKLSDGLFLDCARRSPTSSRSSSSKRCTSTTSAWSWRRTRPRYDVLVMENLFGDVISDLCAGLVGGLGVVPGANIGEQHRRVRGRPRQRAGHRRQGPGEPDRGDDVRGDDAGLVGPGPRGQADAGRHRKGSTPRARCAPATWAAPPTPASSRTPSSPRCEGRRPRPPAALSGTGSWRG